MLAFVSDYFPPVCCLLIRPPMVRWCMATCGCPGKTLPLAFVLVGPNLRKHDAIRLGSSSQAAQPTDRGRIWSRKGDETPHVPTVTEIRVFAQTLRFFSGDLWCSNRSSRSEFNS